MKIVKKLWLLLICFSLSTSPAFANIKIGTVFFYPPFIMSETTGFDIEYLQVICQQLQEPCEFIAMDYYKLFPALNDEKIDIAISGITIPTNNSSMYIYSLPYVLSKGSFIILQKNDIKSISELRGEKIGIMNEGHDVTIFRDYLSIHYNGQFQIVAYDDMEDLIDALSNGKISAAFTHESTALYWELNGSNQFKTIDNPVLIGNGIGVISTPKEANLIQRINQVIKQLEQDDVYLKLYSTYFANEK